ncbi:MAG: DNA repair protein RecO [Erysipelotrichaceae bacterium]|nr:DNA repair protein RecO [Erysipelotrichaceae bacterium]
MNSQNREGRITGLVLSRMEYKDRDAIVKLAVPDAVVSVFAKGVQVPSSKNARLVQPGSKVTLEYDPKYSRDMLYLTRGSLDFYAGHLLDDLEVQTLCQMISQLIEQRGINPEIFAHLEQMWKLLDGKDLKAGYLQAAFILAELCRKEGVQPELTQCAQCGRKDHIEALDFYAGGLVCSEHRHPETSVWPKKRLRQIIALFKAKGAHEDYLLENFDWDADWILMMTDWIQWQLDFRLSSAEFFKRVAKM